MSRDIGNILCRDFSHCSGSDHRGDRPCCPANGPEPGPVNYAFDQVFRGLSTKLADQRDVGEFRARRPAEKWRTRPRSVAYVVNPDTLGWDALALNWGVAAATVSASGWLHSRVVGGRRME